MPTALKRLLLDSDDELNTDSDDSDATAESSSRPQPFAGVMFYVHGEWAGWTRSKVQRAIERHGGKISKTPAFDKNLVTHLIFGGQLWYADALCPHLRRPRLSEASAGPDRGLVCPTRRSKPSLLRTRPTGRQKIRIARHDSSSVPSIRLTSVYLTPMTELAANLALAARMGRGVDRGRSEAYRSGVRLRAPAGPRGTSVRS